LARAASAIQEILTASPPAPSLVVELTAGGPNAIATRWPHAAELLDACGDEARIRFCFDTCHGYAAGYDLSTAEGSAGCWDELATHVGIDRLAVVHANDSRDPCGSRRDRHEQVGKGTIGEEGFRALLSHPLSRGVPWIVETPPRHQAEDVATLRRLAAES
jgi:deoxyribonuclease-4